MERGEGMAVDVGSAKGYLDLDISGFLSGLRSAQSEADSTSKNIATKIGNNLSGVGSKLTSVGTTLTQKVTVPLLGIGATGLKVASDFEKGMSEVKAISGATGKEFDALREKAIELGADTAFSAGEVADAMTEMAKAGWTSNQILDGMSGVLAAAAASGESLATVSTIIADAITGFGLEASDSTRLADLLTQAANSGTIGIADLGESFKYVAPVAGAMSLSVEDVTTALSAMSMAGIKGSQAGTSLRTMLTNLVKPSDKMAEAMDELGISATNSDGSMKSLDEIVDNLRTSFDGLTEAEKAKYAATIAGKEGMSGMLSILNLTEEEYDAIGKSMDNAGGVAEETASIMQDNLQSKVEQLGGALESLAIKLADFVLPYIQQFVVWLTSLIDKFTSLDPELQKTILKFAGLAAVAGPLVTIFGKITSGVGGFFSALGKITSGFKAVAAGGQAGTGILAKLGGALAGITAPMVAIAAAIGLAIAAFVSLWKNNEEFRNNIIGIWNQIKETFDGFIQGIVDRINAFGFDFENITEVLGALWEGFCNLLAPVFEGAFQIVADVFQVITDTILGIVDFFIAVFTGDWQGAWDAVKGIFESVWNGIVNAFESIAGVLIGVAQTVLGWFGVEWNATTEDVGNFFKDVWQGVVDFFVGIWEGVRDFFTGLWQSIWNVVGPLFDEIVGAFQMAWDVIKLIWDYVQPYFAGIWEGIKAVFAVVSEWFKTVFGIAWDLIKAIWDNVVSYFTLIWENIKAVFSVVGTWFKNIFNVAWEAIKAVWNSVVAWFTAIWAGIKAVFAVVKGVLSGNFTDAWNAIKNVWDKVKNFFSTVWDGIKNVFGAVGSFFKNVFSSAWEAIKKVFSNFGAFFSNLWNTIKNTFSAIGTKIGNAISSAVKSGINGVLSMIEGVVNTFVRMINGAINLINLIPGVNIGKLDELRIPRLAKGGIVNSATLAEIGEDGREAVIPLEKNLGWMRNLVKEFMNGLYDFFDKRVNFNEKLDAISQVCQELLYVGRQLVDINMGYVSYDGFGKSRNANKRFDNAGYKHSEHGDTFIFHSPKAIDEIEAAKQMKKAKRDLAEGF